MALISLLVDAERPKSPRALELSRASFIHSLAAVGDCRPASVQIPVKKPLNPSRVPNGEIQPFTGHLDRRRLAARWPDFHEHHGFETPFVFLLIINESSRKMSKARSPKNVKLGRAGRAGPISVIMVIITGNFRKSVIMEISERGNR